MVNRSNLIVCYIQHNSGGAYKAVRYAKNNGETVSIQNADFFLTPSHFSVMRCFVAAKTQVLKKYESNTDITGGWTCTDLCDIPTLN